MNMIIENIDRLKPPTNLTRVDEIAYWTIVYRAMMNDDYLQKLSLPSTLSKFSTPVTEQLHANGIIAPRTKPSPGSTL